MTTTVSPTTSTPAAVTGVVNAIDTLLASLGAAGLPTPIMAEIESLVTTLLPFLDVIFPGLAAVGREAQRESLLNGFYAAGDMAALVAFRDDKPAHPNASVAIANLLIAKLTALTAAAAPFGSMPAAPTAPSVPAVPVVPVSAGTSASGLMSGKLIS